MNKCRRVLIVLIMKNKHLCNKIVDFIDKITIECSWLTTILHFASFVISAFLALSIGVGTESYHKSFLIFVIPVLLDLGIISEDVRKDNQKSFILFVIYVALFVSYLVLFGMSLLALQGFQEVIDFINKNYSLYKWWVLIYSLVYFVEFIAMILRVALSKHIEAKELVINK